MNSKKNPHKHPCTGQRLILISLILALPGYSQFPFPPGIPGMGSGLGIPGGLEGGAYSPDRD
jgi:hypothetical protein